MALFADITDRRRQEEEIRASRARIVEAGDEARRRLERNLHDGAQQRLVALSLTSTRPVQGGDRSRAAAAVLESAREELAAALDELRELARGIIPPCSRTAASPPRSRRWLRSPIPVEIDAPENELPRPVEAAAYYVVAEALANVAKYAGASGAIPSGSAGRTAARSRWVTTASVARRPGGRLGPARPLRPGRGAWRHPLHRQPAEAAAPASASRSRSLRVVANGVETPSRAARNGRFGPVRACPVLLLQIRHVRPTG